MFGHELCHTPRASAVVTTDTASERRDRQGEGTNRRARKELTGIVKDLKTLFKIESVILGIPKLWHAPNPPGGLGAPFHILRDGLDVTDERGNPGPGFKCC